MSKKARIFSFIIYIVLCVGLILLCDHIWPDHKVITKVIPLLVAALITQFVRKAFDYIGDAINSKAEKPFLGVQIKINQSFRKFTGYGASCGEVIQAGNFKADYEVEVEFGVTIQNESPYTVYELEVSYTPNQYSKNYTLTDLRENKLQPLEGNKHFDFRLRIVNRYYDVYASEVDKELRKMYKFGKDKSLLNGSKFNIKYRDSKHKEYTETKVLE